MEDFEKIVVLKDEIQAQLLDGALKERGIPHMLRSYYDSAYDGLFQDQKGWGHVEAPPEFKEEILTILEEMDEGSGDTA